MVTLRSSQAAKSGDVSATPSKRAANGAASSGRSKGKVVSGVPVSTWRLRIAGGIAAGTVFIGFLWWLLSSERLSLSGNFTAEKIGTFGTKLEFTLKFLVLPLVWLFGCQSTICFLRVIRSQAIDPLNGYEDLIEVPRNILSNSVEQFIFSAVGQLTVMHYLSGVDVVRVIPLVNILFVLGRIAYTVGYSKWRSFGFSLTALPNALLIGYALVKFVTTHFL